MTHADLLRVLDYNPLTGIFTWKVSRGRMAKAGDIAGCTHHSGYIHITVFGKYHAAHRLAWFYVKGLWPDFEIDHKNGVRSDNRFDNFRDVTRPINMHNQGRAHSRNKSGVLGAHWFAPQRQWRARIRINKKLVHLGYFKTAEEAGAAYLTAKKELHPSAIRTSKTLDNSVSV